MKNVIYLLFILLSLMSCENEDRIKENLEDYSLSFFDRKKIDYSKYEKFYYKTDNNDYIQYTLKFYKIINKKDSIVIYFTRDSEANYFVEGNDNFYKYYYNHKDSMK